MTYNDISTTNHFSPNTYKILVEHGGRVTEHLIIGKSKKDAISKLKKTGWFVNSSRNIV